jgi:hypothetical protein
MDIEDPLAGTNQDDLEYDQEEDAPQVSNPTKSTSALQQQVTNKQ